MGVVKGGAYGSGLLPVVKVLLEEGVKELSVATVSEGVYLRQHNVTVPITVLGGWCFIAVGESRVGWS